ncbi:MAG: M48 family metalloprotease [Bacteroidetes bacterium]|nr:M48 family metalloprotease [Bacteroidota bacterium]
MAIYVYTGLIHYLDSEDQLAEVLGHEIAHADLRHSTEQMTKNYGLRLAIQFFSSAMVHY